MKRSPVPTYAEWFLAIGVALLWSDFIGRACVVGVLTLAAWWLRGIAGNLADDITTSVFHPERVQRLLFVRWGALVMATGTALSVFIWR